ncbi:MAG TPA: GDSL-type esterase/lipase family protein [Planctomycetota bacterium]|nr:GDSL-type esterase/lipase family protein [Planctomycetota bacterium]
MKTRVRILHVAACLLLATVPVRAAAGEAAGAKPELKLKEGDIVALCGDSITSAGAYPLFMEMYQLVCRPEPKATLLNFGRWGETARQFPPVMDKDVLPAKPTVATICYGMNNCRSGKVMAEAGAKGWADGEILAVVKKFREAGVRVIVLASPGCIDSTHFTLSQSAPPQPGPIEATQKNLSMLRDEAKRLAAAEGLVFADMHTPMVEVMAKAKEKYGTGYAFAGGGGDGVHPGRAGHLVMAWVMLKALGYDGEIGTITVDLAQGGKAEASAGHKVLSAAAGSVELESARYPFCFLSDPNRPKEDKSANATTTVADLFPFNQDLNRLTLVVKGGTGRLKVTWGTQSKEFEAAALEKGVNLAAEFMDNPFRGPFAKVLAGMEERNQCRRWLANEHKGDAGMQKRLDRALENMKVVPVKHTIKVEPAK